MNRPARLFLQGGVKPPPALAVPTVDREISCGELTDVSVVREYDSGAAGEVGQNA